MGRTLQYKKYDGSVEYSAEDRLLHGRILGIRDMIVYGGASIREIDRNFRDAVDEYLQFCERRGKTPDVPFKGSLNVRIPQELHQRTAQYADEHDLKLNVVVQLALNESLTHAE